MKKDKAFIVVGAGILQIPMIKTAQSLGFQVIAMDGDPNAPGLFMANEPFGIDTYQPDAFLSALSRSGVSERYNIKGVATCGADVAPTVARIAEALGLRGISPQVTILTHDKVEVRKALDTANLVHYQPAWMELTEDLKENFSFIKPLIDEHIGNKLLVVKPTQQRASRGVTICRMENLKESIALALEYGPSIIIEECMEGTEHSVEVIFKDNLLKWFNIVDRLFEYDGGVPMEIGHVNPTKLSLHDQGLIAVMVMETAEALGVTWGPFKIDVMMTKDGPQILECTARLSGGFDCQATSPATGRDPVRALVQLASGQEVDPIPDSTDWFAACCAAFPTPGKVKAVPIVSAALDFPGVECCWVVVEPGDMIEPYKHCAQRPAFAITKGETWDIAWQQAQDAAQKLTDGFITERTS